MENQSKDNITELKERISIIQNDNTSPLVYKLTDNVLLREIKNDILNLWPNRNNDHFPGPLPVSLERINLHKLVKYPYLISLKSDGIRFFMINYDNKTYMIDRSFNFFEVYQNFSCIQHAQNKLSMLFDGELIKNNLGNWVYFIHDCVVMDGLNISKEILDTRYEHIKEVLSNNWSYVGVDDIKREASTFNISLKKFYKFEDIEEVLFIINNNKCDHKTDGLIFTPRTLPVCTQTQYSLFKWKPKDSHTFDFKIIDKNNLYNAYVSHNQKDLLYATHEKNSEEGNKFREELEKIGFKSGSIVECSYNDKTESYKPIMIRYDKAHPNSLYTVDKTILNIKEDIKLEEFVNLKQI